MCMARGLAKGSKSRGPWQWSACGSRGLQLRLSLRLSFCSLSCLLFCQGVFGAGLKPLDKDRVLSRITFQLHTPTPPPLTKGSISSAFQAPLTTRQLDHKINPPFTVLEVLLRRDSCLAVLYLIFNILRKFCTDGNEYESTSSTKKSRFYG